MVLEEEVVGTGFVVLLALAVPVEEASCTAAAWTELSLFEF